MENQNKKIGIPGLDVGFKPRIFHRIGKGKQSPRYLIKCGCCDSRLEIYYGKDSLEINGVFASKKEWKKILDTLLSD